jgi:hypothetical protein
MQTLTVFCGARDPVSLHCLLLIYMLLLMHVACAGEWACSRGGRVFRWVSLGQLPDKSPGVMQLYGQWW